ncbi:uncharacterized protein LOC134690445 [Mytilus trossulus]|uniref:uncharacterized protein LOC134690445 n=1 Tax=Mytilus trossulus TaxID=6551 RepID=UPI0030058C7F
MKVSLLCVALVFIVTIQLAVSEGDEEDNDRKGTKRRQFPKKKDGHDLGKENRKGKGQRGPKKKPSDFMRENAKRPEHDWSKRQEKNAAQTDHKLRGKRNAFNERRRSVRDASLDVKEILRQNLLDSLRHDQNRNLNRNARDVKASRKLQDMVIQTVAEKVNS